MKRSFTGLPLAAAAAALIALGGCGGGGGSAPSIPQAPGSGQGAQNNTANAQIKITIPSAASLSGRIHRDYVSPSTKSTVISLVAGGKTTQLAQADLTTSSTGCQATSGGTQCSISFIAPAGSDVLSMSLYNQTGGKGSVLATAQISATLVSGQANTVPVVLDGVPTTAQVILGSSQLKVGTAGSVSVIVQATDASGNVIVGPGTLSEPIALAITNDPYKTLSLSSASVNAPGQAVTLNYNGGSLTGAVITPSASGLTGTSATFAGEGASLTMFQFLDTADNLNYWYPYAIQPLTASPASAAVELEYQACCPTNMYGIGVVTPTGFTKVFTGDTTDPYNVPAAGSLTYNGLTVVNGMSKNLVTWEGSQVDKELAVSSSGTVYYAGSASSTTASTCSGGELITGTLGALNTTAGTTVERVLKGYPMYMQFDPAGNLWFIEDSGNCNVSGNLLPSGYAVGELTASGALTETDFGSTGLTSVSPDSMALSTDGTEMYVGDDNSGNLMEVPLPGLSGVLTATLTNSFYPHAIAVASDKTVAWFSDEEPNNNYWYGFIPGTMSFATASVTEQLFPITYFYSSGMTYADGSFWLAGAEYGTGFGRLSGWSSGSMTAGYYAVPYPNGDGQKQTGISAGGGYIWAGDNEYGNVDILQYGAPSNGNVTFNTTRHLGQVLSKKNPQPRPARISKVARPVRHR